MDTITEGDSDVEDRPPSADKLTVRIFASDMFERASLAALCEARGYGVSANDRSETVLDTTPDIAIVSAEGYDGATVRDLAHSCLTHDIRTIVVAPNADEDSVVRQLERTTIAAVVTRETAAYYLGQILGLVACGVRIRREPPRFPAETGRPAAVPNMLLTERESEVLAKIVAGHPNKVIAHELGISEGTARIHTKSIMRKCGAASRTQVAIWCLKGGKGRARPGEDAAGVPAGAARARSGRAAPAARDEARH